jgi:integrase/recombinase XerD
MTVALCGIKFLYQHTPQREWRLLDLARAKQEKRLPAVLSVEEVAQVLSCVHQPRYRACLTTIYACGLRIREGVYLQVADIGGSRRMLHVRKGKGGQNAMCPCPRRPWNYCALIGAAIATRCGYFRRDRCKANPSQPSLLR